MLNKWRLGNYLLVFTLREEVSRAPVNQNSVTETTGRDAAARPCARAQTSDRAPTARLSYRRRAGLYVNAFAL